MHLHIVEISLSMLDSMKRTLNKGFQSWLHGKLNRQISSVSRPNLFYSRLCLSQWKVFLGEIAERERERHEATLSNV